MPRSSKETFAMMQCEGPDAPLAVRTDEARFEGLSSYPFTANYLAGEY